MPVVESEDHPALGQEAVADGRGGVRAVASDESAGTGRGGPLLRDESRRDETRRVECVTLGTGPSSPTGTA